MKFKPFSQKDDSLVLDIGTETVKALALKKEKEKINVLGAALQYFDRFSVFDSRDFEKDVIKKAISGTLEEIRRQSKIEPKFFILGLPATIFKARIVSQSFPRKDLKNPINKKEEEDLCQQILAGAKKTASRRFAEEFGILSKDIQFVDFKVLEMKIDGYRVPDIKGYDGKILEFKLLITFLAKSYLQNFQRITKDLNLEILKIVHPAQNLTNFLLQPNAFCLDVGGQITQILLIKDGRLELVNEFGIGGEIFSEELSLRLGINQDEARDLKEKYSKGTLSEEVRKKIKEILSRPAKLWFEALGAKLKEKKGLIPPNICLFGGGSQVPEIQEILKEEDWKDIPLTGAAEAKILTIKDLKTIEDKAFVISNPQYISSLFLFN